MLLVSIQTKVITMEVYDLNHAIQGVNTKSKKQSPICLDKNKILCKHCKRTASNGIRCMGICVADNDY